MKVKLNTIERDTKPVMHMRDKIESCADGIIDNMNEQMIMSRVYDEFGHDIDIHDAERIANIVWEQIKHRM